MRTIPLAVSAVLLLAACATTAPAPSVEDAPPVWTRTESPWPLPPLEIVPGESVPVDLRFATVPGVDRVVAVRSEPPGLVQSDIGERGVGIHALQDADGAGTVLIDVVCRDGREATLGFPVVVTPKPVVTFSYDPAGENPESVTVAGEFNGWNSQSHRLDRGSDGGFSAAIAIEPGVWNYKFVVDGEWIADPSNPRTDASGYGNSVLEVRGVSRPPLAFVPLSRDMPGAGPLGGVAISSPAGAPIDGANLRVFFDNRPVPPDELDFDPETNVLAFGFKANGASGESGLVVLAGDGEGHRGVFRTRLSAPDAQRAPRDEVLYYALADRFRNGDRTNDPALSHPELHPLANYMGGDFAGLLAALREGYFDDLGVTTLWISPVNRNTMKIERDAVPPHRLFTSYHGYWPVSSTETNPAFGTMEELRAVVDEAHARGIAVILDFVANHVHEDHPLHREHPEWATDLLLGDGEPNIRLFDAHPFTTWFDEFLPTFDYAGNAELVEIMTDNALYWLDSTGADGFRHDAVKHIPEEFWVRLTEKIDERSRLTGRRYFQVGETISDRGTISRFVGPDLLDGQFDFPLLFAIQSVIARGDGSMRDLGDALLQSQAGYPSAATMSPLIGNHDVVRFMGLADGDMPPGVDEKEVGYSDPPTVDSDAAWEKLALAYGLLFACPGPPTIYYGDEIGMTGAHDPDNRRAMTWDTLDSRQRRIRDLVASLAAARRNSPALRRGHVTVLYADEQALVLARTSPAETVLAVLKRGADPVALELPKAWGEVALAPLVSGGVRAGTRGGTVRFHGPARDFGYWRVVSGSAR